MLYCLPPPWSDSSLHLEWHSGKVAGKRHQFPSAQFFWMSLLEEILCCFMPWSRELNLSAPANLSRNRIHRHICWGPGSMALAFFFFFWIQSFWNCKWLKLMLLDSEQNAQACPHAEMLYWISKWKGAWNENESQYHNDKHLQNNLSFLGFIL